MQSATPARKPRLTRSLLGWTIICGIAVFVGVVALEMSGSAQRLAATNDIGPNEIVGQSKAGQKICQPGVTIPSGGVAVRMEIFTYNKPMPLGRLTLTDASGKVVDSGTLEPGGPQGMTTIPLAKPKAVTGTLCIKASGPLAFGGQGEPAGPTTMTINRAVQGASIAVLVMLRGNKSWWQLLPDVIRRFGYGKWSFLGSWTFIAAGLALVFICILALRTFWKEAS